MTAAANSIASERSFIVEKEETGKAGAASAPSPSSAVAFQFVADLAAEVSEGRVELPSFPDVANQVRKVLSNENVSPEQIARVVGSDADLAARVMMLANSAALNPAGKTVSELKSAVSRIGHNNVRTAAMAFALAKLRYSEELRPIKQQLEILWGDATLVAMLSHLVAKQSTGINADEALLAGLLHNVGKIYILARAHKYPDLFTDAVAINSVISDWQTNVGKAVVENWEFASNIAEAVGGQMDFDQVKGYPDLTDVLSLAVLLSSYVDQHGNSKQGDGQEIDFELNMQGVRACGRLGFNNQKFNQVLADCREEMAALRAALGS